MRATFEREKALMLRSLKELEFDRAMDKVSAKDFDEMASRLRARAVSLMKQLDEEGAGYRAVIERELATRMRQPVRSTGPESPAVRPAEEVAAGACAACGTANDSDAHVLQTLRPEARVSACLAAVVRTMLAAALVGSSRL